MTGFAESGCRGPDDRKLNYRVWRELTIAIVLKRKASEEEKDCG